MWFFKQKKYPEFWHVYNRKQQEKTTDFVVIDIETTGLDYKNDQILSVGVVKINDHQIKLDSCKEWQLKRDFKSFEAIPIHGIVPSVETTDETSFIEAFLDYIGNATLVGHHVDFDIKIINQLLLNNRLNKLKNNVLDTEKIFKKQQHWSQEQHINLDDLLKHCQLKPLGRHTALGDAFSTALVFIALRQ